MKVKFFNMTLQSPHEIFNFNTSIFSLTIQYALLGMPSLAPTEKLICPFLCSHWKIPILSYLLYIVITYFHTRFLQYTLNYMRAGIYSSHVPNIEPDI